MARMAAFFAVLFGTPVVATVFALGIISVGAISLDFRIRE